MSKFTIPYDNTNSTNPYLINRKEGLIKDVGGNDLSAEYIWSKVGKDRDDLVEYVFQYYRKNGFPYKREDDKILWETYGKLREKDVEMMMNDNGEIVNSNSTATNVIKHFMGELFYSTRGKSKGLSCMDAFLDDEIFRDVLRNRMGYRVSKEDGTERPYVFSISDDMVLQGMRSSGLGFSTSQFKPMLGKWVFDKYAGKGAKVLDYSAGWGARALAAGSLDQEYIGIDPLTYGKIANMMTYFGIAGKAINGCSEDEKVYDGIGDVDLCFSSPPYFNLEVYSGEETQSYSRFVEYEKWLEGYWNETVKNCCGVLREGGKFAVCIVDKVGKFDIGKDMVDICGRYFEPVEEVPISVCRSHLSGKRESKQVTKTTEKLYVFEKKQK